MVVKKIAIVFGLILYSYILFAQGEIAEQDKIFYKNERTFAILLNSNGLGVNYRYGKRITELKKVIYDVDLVNIKHPKEIKLTAQTYYFTSKNFVYGKLNQFYNLRLGIGIQNEMFPKVDKGGISIRRYFSFGTSIGIKKPIYYTIGVDENGDSQIDYEVIEKFSFTQHLPTTNITGRASFFKGFNEISFVPGIYGKFGLMFEFGKFNKTINAVDAGIIVDAFAQKIPIMAMNSYPRFFLTLYASYRFGKVIDAKYKMKKTKLDKIVTD